MTDLPVAKTRPASNWSAIWVLPLIALIIGGWLGWRAWSETGIEIQVRFESGEGIQVNKTEVVYKACRSARSRRSSSTMKATPKE